MRALLITVGRLRPGGDGALQQYAAGVMPLIAAAGGEVLSRGRPEETIVGDEGDRPDLVAVIRFPSAEAIRAFLGSGEYQGQVPFRNAAFADVRSYMAADLMV
jgi:uncharacterized protein (DUF1330 family)